MLSKYYSYLTNGEVKADVDFTSALASSIRKLLGTSDVRQINPGGTLGVFFEAKYNGKRKFLKTHTNFCSNENLEKEISIMKYLYKDLFSVESFLLHINGNAYSLIMMDYLNLNNKSCTPVDALKLIDCFKGKLKSFNNTCVNYGTNDLKVAAVNSYIKLSQNGFLSSEIRENCELALLNLDQYCQMETEICHGDLSSENITWQGDSWIAIDWEDALLGFENYDLLYWLTFFSQRKYYSVELLQKLNINRIYGKDVMLVILLVKSYLSYVRGHYKNNMLSINDRLLEIVYKL